MNVRANNVARLAHYLKILVIINDVLMENKRMHIQVNMAKKPRK